jgi:hypothetical protein
MTTPRDPDRLIRAFLAEGPTDLADRTYDAVRSDIERTRQRVAIGPWREPRMNNITRIAIAAAAVLVVAVVGYNLLPGISGSGGPSVTPSPSPTLAPTPAPTPALTPEPTPSPTEAAFPPDGPLAPGTHTAILEGVRVSFTIPGPGWTAIYGAFVGFGPADGQLRPEDYSFALWDNAPDNVYSDPCAHTRLSPPPDHTAIGLATAAAAIPGTDLVSGPESVEVGGRPAQHVVFTVRDDLGCDPLNAYLWVDDGTGAANNWHWASALGSTHQVWTIDVDGKVIWIDSESWKGAAPEVGQAIQAFIDSITFE